MIIAGNCSYVTKEDQKEIIDTANSLINVADLFRCKIWLGGTRPDRYYEGIGSEGVGLLEHINNQIISCGTEVQIPAHINLCSNLSYLWVGARNSQNYSLLQAFKDYKGAIMIKRGSGMTIDETIGIFDIMKDVNHIKEHNLFIIERGINTFDRKESSRWSPDLKGVIRIKKERPDIFNNLVVDCSHSVGEKNYIEDTYKAFKSIGVEHFMFECTHNPANAKTDKGHVLSVLELKGILNEGL